MESTSVKTQKDSIPFHVLSTYCRWKIYKHWSHCHACRETD